MKETKFRLRDRHNKIVGYEKWYTGLWHPDNPDEGFSLKSGWWEASPCWLYSVDSEKWTPTFIPHRYKDPCTGLKDKNGKEIYEGDIVLVPDEWTEPILDSGSGPREPCNHLAPVAFESGSFGIVITDRADTYSKGFWSFPVIIYEIGDKPEEFEVIGNIYSDKELLE